MCARKFLVKSEDVWFSSVGSLKVLPKSQGFPLDLRPARQDRLAYHCAGRAWGYSVVDKILETLHRSSLTYEALREDFLEYDVNYAPSMRDDPVYQLAFQSVRREWVQGDRIVPLTLGAVARHPDMPRMRSAGLPFKLEGLPRKGDVVDNAEAMHGIMERWQLRGAGINVPMPDCCLFARAQIARVEKEKIRSTWGYPMEVYLEEGRFFYPLLDSIKAHEITPPIGYQVEMATGGMHYIQDMIAANKQGKIKVCDWSKFDKYVPPWLIRDAFAIIGEKIDFGHVRDVEGNVWRVRSNRSLIRWKKIVDYFINTPIRHHNGERFQKSGGVPSGSCFTNVIDSIVNEIVQRYIVYETTGQFPLAEVYLGDDSLTIESGNVNLDDQARLAAEKFGFKLNVAKSYVTTNPANAHFLGYFNSNGWPLKAQDFSIASFILPEHTVRDPLLTAARAVGQMWCSFDPYWAKIWHGIIMDICEHEGISIHRVIDEIRAHPQRYKFLMHVGVKTETISIPEPTFDGVLQVVPPPVPRKKYVRTVFDYHKIWDEACEYWDPALEEIRELMWLESVEKAQLDRLREQWAHDELALDPKV